MTIWDRKCRPASIPEEKLHCEQRLRWVHDRRPDGFAKQACGSVITMVSKIYHEKGGRSLCLKPTIVRKAYTCGTRKHKKYTRPAQFGNAMFSWVGENMTAEEPRFELSVWMPLGVRWCTGSSSFSPRCCCFLGLLEINLFLNRFEL